MTDDEIIGLCTDQTDENGKEYNYHRIIKGIRNMKISTDSVFIKYKFAKQRKSGRRYSSTFSLQNMPSDIRNFLTRGNYCDYDMINCHFQILNKLCRQHNLERDAIEKYVKKRDLC